MQVGLHPADIKRGMLPVTLCLNAITDNGNRYTKTKNQHSKYNYSSHNEPPIYLPVNDFLKVKLLATTIATPSLLIRTSRSAS